jgi:hypothetical protein
MQTDTFVNLQKCLFFYDKLPMKVGASNTTIIYI